jgi:hypothetical protein
MNNTKAVLKEEGHKVIPYKLYNNLFHIPLENTTDYNYVEGDLVYCKGRFYTFKEHAASGDVHCFDRKGYSTYLKIDDIQGSIKIGDYPEYLL